MARKCIDQCICRGCGGWLSGVGSEVYDGETATCMACKRTHTFHVAEDGGPVVVTIERKRRAATRQKERA
jgi:hypothetical protein